MPAQDRVDPTVLDAVTAALARAGAATLDASHELLAHYADTGEATTQRVVDTLVDNAADALRALTDTFADTSHGLAAVAAAHSSMTRSLGAREPSTRTSRRRGPVV